MANKKAFITGITGQDGSYLAELLLDKGYEVHGMVRPNSTSNRERIDHLYIQSPQFKDTKLFLHYGDMMDTSSLNRLMEKIAPTEIYNLAAQSHVHVSFDIPDYTAEVNAMGTLRLLDALRQIGLTEVKFYQASTSELFGKVTESPQDEKTPLHPRSPYAIAKAFGYWIAINYREAYNFFTSNGILFNHESPRRNTTFVTRKITIGAAKIALGLEKRILLGNLNSQRDWGYAPEYCEGMWKILQNDKPDDFILATGKTNSVREFVNLAFKNLGVEIEWSGKDENEKGIIKNINSKYQEAINSTESFVKIGQVVIEVSPYYYRPAEVDTLRGNPAKAKKLLNWEASTSLEELVAIMVEYDLSTLKK